MWKPTFRARGAPPREWLALLFSLFLASAGPPFVHGQAPADGETDAGWNSPRALELAHRAVMARGHYADTVLRNFQARAEGHVYFLAELRGERQLVRADQVAVEILWQAPDRALQTIVGRRHDKRLPSRVRYHIDHLVVVLDNYGDRIRIGEGEEVRDVLHPAAPGALRHYDYRLADSLEIRVRDRITRLYRLQVRPSEATAPGLVGSVFVDRRTGSIARLRGTFTAASYVDPQLDYVTVDLRSALWEGRWWLPAEQEVELRREVRWLDFPVGGIIRTEMRIREYRLNEEVPYALAEGERVAALPPGQLERYDDWELGLYAGVRRPEERGEPELDRLKAEARELVGARALLAAAPMRPHLSDASGALRARRAEGLRLGVGGRFRIDGLTAASVQVGWPFARERPQAEVGLTRQIGLAELELRLVSDRPRDVGPFPAAAGTVSTLGMALDGEDWVDPYFEAGGELRAVAPVLGGTGTFFLQALRQRSAWLAAGPLLGGSARPVRPVDHGTLTGTGLRLERGLGEALAARWRLDAATEAGLAGPGDFGYGRFLATLEADGERPGASWGWSGRLAAGFGTGELPAQRLFLLGGRGTLPGHSFRGWGGDRIVLADLQLSREVFPPWLRARIQGAAGGSWLEGPGAAAAGRLEVQESRTLRASTGAGVGLFYDLLRLDAFRGLGAGGGWEVIVSVNPRFWGIL